MALSLVSIKSQSVAKCRKLSQSVAECWFAAFCNSLRQDVSIGRRVLQNFGAMIQ